ncbi:hypothetical protein H4V97_001826 [Flavobacterium sp. CG_23.5]|nr:hypothetical protein [Flavobacterium sp. CG_23.5]
MFLYICSDYENLPYNGQTFTTILNYPIGILL